MNNDFIMELTFDKNIPIHEKKLENSFRSTIRSEIQTQLQIKNYDLVIVDNKQNPVMSYQSK